jgi:hypothetical protein
LKRLCWNEVILIKARHLRIVEIGQSDAQAGQEPIYRRLVAALGVLGLGVFMLFRIGE